MAALVSSLGALTVPESVFVINASPTLLAPPGPYFPAAHLNRPLDARGHGSRLSNHPDALNSGAPSNRGVTTAPFGKTASPLRLDFLNAIVELLTLISMSSI